MTKRWLVRTFYRCEADTSVQIEELKELQAVVETGPNWNTIDRIEISLLREIGPRLTLQESAEAGDHAASEVMRLSNVA